MNKNDKFTDWFKTPYNYQPIDPLPYQKGYEQWFIDHFSPFTTQYFSELNPMFSYQIKYMINKLVDEKVILLRDGIVALLWFFFSNKPNDFKQTLLVHSRFANYIPPKWSHKIKLYSYINNAKQNAREKIIINCFFCEDYLSSEYVKKRIDKISEQIPSRSVEIFAPIKELDTTSQEHFISFLDNVRDKFTRIDKIWSWKTLLLAPNFSHYSIFEINEGTIMADSYMNHFFNTKKGQIFLDYDIDNPHITKEFQDYKLSYNHSIRIFSGYNFLLNKFPPEKAFINFEIIEHHFKKREFFPWPDDFFAFVKHYC